MTEGVPEARIKLGPLGPGFILDLCAGGEGVIARAYPGRVLGVDQQLSEIKEARAKAPADAVFLLGDATRTPFVDNTFPYVTAFFGLLYVKGDEAKRALFAEAARVLRPGGHFLVWDAAVAAPTELVAVQVRVELPDGDVVRAGYGCRGSTGEMNLDRLNDLAKGVGLRVAAAEDYGAWFEAAFESPLTA